MKPLCSVCAFRIWKISSCLRIPVAPATCRSLATWVSRAMLMSLSSPMLSVSLGRRGDGLDVSGGGASAVAAVSGAGREGAVRLLLLAWADRSFDYGLVCWGRAARIVRESGSRAPLGRQPRHAIVNVNA